MLCIWCDLSEPGALTPERRARAPPCALDSLAGVQNLAQSHPKASTGNTLNTLAAAGCVALAPALGACVGLAHATTSSGQEKRTPRSVPHA